MNWRCELLEAWELRRRGLPFWAGHVVPKTGEFETEPCRVTGQQATPDPGAFTASCPSPRLSNQRPFLTSPSTSISPNNQPFRC